MMHSHPVEITVIIQLVKKKVHSCLRQTYNYKLETFLMNFMKALLPLDHGQACQKKNLPRNCSS